jgi:hypothetical protein
MSRIVDSKQASTSPSPEIPVIEQPLSRTSWQALCGWLTHELKGIETTIERRNRNGEWVVECISYPLESVTTRWMTNGVQIISIKLKANGNTLLFEVPRPTALEIRKNATGWPVRIELGSTESQTVLLFSEQMEPQKISQSHPGGRGG